MKKQKIKPKWVPLPRVWFMARGYRQAPLRYTKNEVVWLHPQTNDVLSKYGTRLYLRVLPDEKYQKTTAHYLALCRPYGSMYLARLKYLTFVGPIPPGCTIDHIDGDTMNNDIRNLRCVSRAINDRDGGFMRKLRNNKIYVKMFPGIILEGYARMAEWKASHTEWAYRQLKGDALKAVFLGSEYVIVNPHDAAEEERNKYC